MNIYFGFVFMIYGYKYIYQVGSQTIAWVLFIIFFLTGFTVLRGQSGTMTGTGMSICNLYSFSTCPTQTITPLNYGSQNYSCNNTLQPDVSFNVMGSGWRVNKFGWFFTATTNGVLSGYTSAGIFQSFPFSATNTITPLTYSGNFVQFAINGVSTGSLLSQSNFSISLMPVVFGSNSYTFCPSTATSIAISPTIPPTGGPWTYNWQPGGLTGGTVNVSPSANTIYTITANSSAGCSSNATVAVNINCVPPPLCSGNLGAPVFFEDFGSGIAVYGPTLPPGVTNYIYQTGPPPNGTYVISSTSNPSGINLGYVADGDHTGNVNGYMMVINSDYPAAEVYRKHVTDLCPNTTYVFSSYLSNNNTPTTPNTVCPGYVYANVKLQIEYPLGTIQNSVTTGNLPLGLSNTTLNWNEYGFVFTTLPWQTTVDIVLKNNAPGGCGNDYVVDDISLSPCGPGVSLNIVPSQSVFCIGDSVSLQSSYTSGGYSNPQYQWQFSSDGGNIWTNINGAISTNYNINSVLGSQAGMYHLLCSENGNINLGSCRIVAGPLTFSVSGGISVSATATVCLGSSTVLTVNGGSNYLWSTGIASNSITISPVVNTTYSVVGIVSGCTSQAVTTVSVIPNPITSISGNTVICAGYSSTLTVGGVGSYLWNTGVATSSIVITPVSTNSYSVVFSNGTCSATAVTTVNVLSPPTLTVSADTTICSNSVSVATLSAGGANSYTWANASTLSSSTGSLVSAFPITLTNYTVIGSIGSCTNSAIITVSVSQSPTVSLASVKNTSCGLANGSATIIAVPLGTVFNWSGGISSVSGEAASLAADDYSVTIKNGPCQTHTVITVLGSIPLIIVSKTVTPATCVNTGGSIIVNDNLGNSSYSWSPGSFANSNSISNLAAGSYSVTVTNGACSNSSVFIVGLTPGPSHIAIIKKNVVCEKDSGSISIINVIGGISPYQYSINNSGYSSVTSYSNLTEGSYNLFVKDSNQCIYTQSISVERTMIKSSWDLTIIPPDCESENGSFTFNNFKGGTAPYLLDFNNNGYSSNTVFESLAVGSYTLNVLDSNKCLTSSGLNMSINVNDYILYIPNAFTPNKDDKNDVWFVKAACLNSFNCSIYNRWGEKIAVLKNINESWDGTYNGTPVQDGVYVYLIEAEIYNGTINRSGHFTLLR